MLWSTRPRRTLRATVRFDLAALHENKFHRLFDHTEQDYQGSDLALYFDAYAEIAGKLLMGGQQLPAR